MAEYVDSELVKFSTANFHKIIRTEIDKDEILHIYFDIGDKTWEAFYRDWDWEKFNGNVVFKTGKPAPYQYKCCFWSPATREDVSERYKDYCRGYEDAMVEELSEDWDLSPASTKMVMYTVIDAIIKKLNINLLDFHKNYIAQYSVLRG